MLPMSICMWWLTVLLFSKSTKFDFISSKLSDIFASSSIQFSILQYFWCIIYFSRERIIFLFDFVFNGANKKKQTSSSSKQLQSHWPLKWTQARIREREKQKKIATKQIKPSNLVFYSNDNWRTVSLINCIETINHQNRSAVGLPFVCWYFLCSCVTPNNGFRTLICMFVECVFFSSLQFSHFFAAEMHSNEWCNVAKDFQCLNMSSNQFRGKINEFRTMQSKKKRRIWTEKLTGESSKSVWNTLTRKMHREGNRRKIAHDTKATRKKVNGERRKQNRIEFGRRWQHTFTAHTGN